MTITINGYTYRTTAVRMGGRFLVPLERGEPRGRRASPPATRSPSTSRSTPRPARSTLPADLAAAMDDAARAAYDGLSYTHRKEWVRWVEEAKKPETRATRIEKTVAGLREGEEDALSPAGTDAVGRVRRS